MWQKRMINLKSAGERKGWNSKMFILSSTQRSAVYQLSCLPFERDLCPISADWLPRMKVSSDTVC